MTRWAQLLAIKGLAQAPLFKSNGEFQDGNSRILKQGQDLSVGQSHGASPETNSSIS